MHQDTNGSSVDDFRSVIDDLTVENKKLKARIRKLETTHTAHLEKDKLFEVKVHGLSRRQKRQLEETLRDFASQVATNRIESTTAQLTSKDEKTSYISLPQQHGLASSSATSDSRPLDSGYASMSTPGAKSASTSNHIANDIFTSDSGVTMAKSKANKVQSFLDDMPAALLPKHPEVIPEKMKKKLVVKRLEQLFTGKKGMPRGIDSHSLQQQEVSNMAAENDRGAHENRGPEGIREAHILQSELELDKTIASKLQAHSNPDFSDYRGVSNDKSPPQRPTRPLDIDPDRAQVPSENLEYIRHLGISSPQSVTMSSNDTAMDEDGWVYLNLLTNLAQLHIINVTPQFIRSAVSEVSTKFQLSSDGKKIRWKGGTEGTTFSSDSGAESAQNGSPNDSDSVDEGYRKRRKFDCGIEGENEPQQKDLSLPGTGTGQNHRLVPHVPGQQNTLQYRPLFRHNNSSDFDVMSVEDSIPPASNFGSDVYDTGLKSRSTEPSKQRRNGTIVFYNGAPFCTDLSADRDNISTPLHVADVGKDGFSNHTHDALGCTHTQSPGELSRTASGSAMPFRPFKDYTICASQSVMETETPDIRPSELESGSDDLEFSPKWAATDIAQKVPLLHLEACGLGGSRPADHFAITVETSHTIIGSGVRPQLSKFSAPSPKPRKIAHSISQSSLGAIHSYEDSVGSRLTELKSQSNSTSTAPPAANTFPRLQAEILSAQLRHLRPSKLPPPTNYFAACSSSGDSFEMTSDSNSDTDSHSNADIPLRQSYARISALEYEPMDEDDLEDDDEGESLEDDSSIDMLAQARAVDPATVAALEKQFEPETMGTSVSSKATAGHESDVILTMNSPVRPKKSVTV